MELSPSRDINSSVGRATRISGATGLQLHIGLRGGTMPALCELMQTRYPDCHDEDDADGQRRENDQKPICLHDHGCTCLDEEPVYCVLPPQ
jgi:hypothetical protein